jgi:hypothetical protein
VHDVEDVGEQRSVCCLMPGQGLQQLPAARHRERQDQPVSLGETEGPFGGLVRCALVTELTISESGQKVCLNNRDVTDDWGRAVQNIP